MKRTQKCLGGNHVARASAASAALLALVLGQGDASACGCLTPPIPAIDEEFAVNQQSEQIIFEVGEGSITAHVLIRYAGEAESFAWLVPVPAVPEIDLSFAGTFGRIDTATRPTRRVNATTLCPSQRYACRQHNVVCQTPTVTTGAPPGGGYGYAADGADYGAAQSADANLAESLPDAPPVQVYSRQQIGSYETIVFGADEAGAAVDWLNDEGFIVNETMSPYMQPYLDENMLFVASKLVPGAGVDEIRPLKMTYEATVPGIPLRLTAVAAEPHLTVTAYIFSDSVFEPVGHPIVELDPVDLTNVSLVGSTDNYPQLISRQIDEVGGDGFIHEYSGRLAGAGLSQCCYPQDPAVTGQVAVPTDPTLTTDPVKLAESDPFEDAGTAPDAGVIEVEPVEPATPDWCSIGGDGQCQCPNTEFDRVDCGSDTEELLGSMELYNELVSKYSTMTRLTTRLSADEMIFDPFFEPSDDTSIQGPLTLSGSLYRLDSCADDVVDQEAYERVEALRGCAGVYCGDGACALGDNNEAGCVCDEGFVARAFTELDGSRAVTCVFERAPVDFAAGGLELPDPCRDADVESGDCLDIGGFAAVRCDEGTVATMDSLALSQGVPSCVDIDVEGDDPGGLNPSLEFEDMKVCAPAPPACPVSGWLEELPNVAIEGEDCEQNRPDASWFDVPPAPTCDELQASTAAGESSVTSGVSVTSGAASGDDADGNATTTDLTTPMDTRGARPEVDLATDGDSSSRTRTSGGCGLATPSGTQFLWGGVALLGLVMLRRRKRR